MITRREALQGAFVTLAAVARPCSSADAPGPRRRIGAGYFGMHFHRLVRKPGEVSGATRWPVDVTIGRLRLWDAETRWADLVPRPGAWTFDRMDAYVGEAREHRAQIVYTLGSPPSWASARPDEAGPYGPGSAAEPRRIEDWIEYVQRVVTRYRGVIGAYEIWNEPNFSDVARDRADHGFYTGSVRTMVELARAARNVLREIDPSALLVTPGFVNGPDRLALFLNKGGASLVDAVAYHFYAHDSAHFAAQISEVRQTMRDAHVAHLPLWNTECGVETSPTHEADAADAQMLPAELDAGRHMAQLLLLGAALGLEHFDYYAWDNGRTGMVDANAASLPRRAAFAKVQSWLIDSEVALATHRTAGVTYIAGRRGDDRFALLWADRSGPVDVPMPASWGVTASERLFDRAAELMPAQRLSAVDGSVRCMLSAAPLRLQLAQLDSVPTTGGMNTGPINVR